MSCSVLRQALPPSPPMEPTLAMPGVKSAITPCSSAQWSGWLLEIIALLARMLIVAISLLIFTPPVMADSYADLGAPQLFTRDGPGVLTPVELGELHLEIDIVADVAHVQLTQSFLNDRETWTDAVYLLPLPDNAAVHRYALEAGDRLIEGLVLEKEVARAVFEKARFQGQRAGLVEYFDAGLFRIDLANLEPESHITIVMEMTLPLEIHGRDFSLRFPTTVTPRYRQKERVPGDVGVSEFLGDEFSIASLADWQRESGSERPLIYQQTSLQHPMSYTVRLRPMGGAVRALRTPLHDSRFHQADGVIEVVATQGAAAMDRDFLLRWSMPDFAEPEPVVTIAQSDDQWFASLNMIEPAVAKSFASSPRELILIVDVSGSMAGESLRQAKIALEHALSQLRPVDRFNLIAFDHRVFELFEGPEYVLPSVLEEAREFIRGLEADGGTEMEPALMRALEQVSPGALSQLLFLTDGAVSNEAALFRALQAHLGRARLSTIAIGAAPNSAFMRQAAVIGRGLYRDIAHPHEAAPMVSEVLDTLAQPVVTDLEIEWPVSVTPSRALPPDLYRGEPVRSLVRFDDVPWGGVITVRGMFNGWPWRREVPLPSWVPQHGSASSSHAGDGIGVPARWAQEFIQSSLDEAVLDGIDPDSLRNRLLPLALAHRLVTPFTSLVAVEARRARPPEQGAGRVWLPNPPPTVDYRFAQTATPAGLWIFTGMFLLLMGCVVWTITRERPAAERVSP